MRIGADTAPLIAEIFPLAEALAKELNAGGGAVPAEIVSAHCADKRPVGA